MRLRAFALVMFLTAGALGTAPAAVAAPFLGERCARGGPDAAAVELFGAGTEVLGTDVVAGLQTVLALEPHILPGTRHRLIAVPLGWCDAETSFNMAWELNDRGWSDSLDAVEAYAQLAAAPYFDETEVRHHAIGGAVHVLTTHALTNGVQARWTITADDSGIRTASWVATAFAVRPLVAQWEGMTALRGASERYARTAGGLLHAQRGLPQAPATAGRAPNPGDEVTYVGPDGFKIVIGIGDLPVGADSGLDTGVPRADILRMTREVVAENYQDFYDWGLRGNWTSSSRYGPMLHPPLPQRPQRTGYVFIDDYYSLFCIACVFSQDDFQISFISELRSYLAALGVPYTGVSDRDVLATALGHEMFHNWQNNYLRPESTGRIVSSQYLEGTARMQQTLHRYSEIEHQAGSLVYLRDGSGCNGFLAAEPPDQAMAAGPMHSVNPRAPYPACNFYLTWYGGVERDVLVRLLWEATPAAEDAGGTTAGRTLAAIENASGEPYAVAASRWAAALITGNGMRWGPAAGKGQTVNWGDLLDRWEPQALEIGRSVTTQLVDGGVAAYEVKETSRPSVGDGAVLAVVRASGADTTVSFPANRATLAGPATGERVYVVAVGPKSDSLQTVISLAHP
jgi:hypothetical protein